MSTAATSVALEALPPATRTTLQALTDALEKALGKNLAALVVYGSAARGGYVPDESDIDVIVVLEDTALPHLHAIAKPLTLARYRGRVEAMILKRDNLSHAADVFPLLYDDLRQKNVILSGIDVFAGLHISNTHRRLRIEQELREARIRMRRAVVDALGSEANIAGAVARKVKQIRSPLHALLCLKGLTCDDGLEAVLAGAGKAYGIDTGSLTRVAGEPEKAHTALRALLDAAILDVDAMPDGVHA
jgi:hypothetical protein